ncbi:MAG: hypothetical protein IJV01_04795 [Bacteroidales bacterium]|nr:hypothetical protein [Bacteroidales bacterium]
MMTKLTLLLLAALLDFVPAGEAFLQPLQKRDSILVADQLEYGFRLDSVASGTLLALPDFSQISGDTLTLVRGWQVDTLKARRRQPWRSIRAHVVIAPFEEGTYHLPPIPVLRTVDGKSDTLLFSPQTMDVKTIPIDTATFKPHDIKGQIGYPLTAREVLPWLLGAILLAVLIFLLLRWLERRRDEAKQAPREPAHIVALRRLEHWRDRKYWAPDKQKVFYSGVTDTLKEYIGERYGMDAPEMTTAELFTALKDVEGVEKELYGDMKDLFERADFVKFAKHVADDGENASVLPVAVRFVSSTCVTEPEEGPAGDEL